MKKFLLLIVLFVFARNVKSQVLISLLLGEHLNTGKIEFGLVGGYNWSKINGFESNNALGKYNLGFYFDIRIHKPWYVYTGVYVKSNLGSGKLTKNDLQRLDAETFEPEGEYSQITKTFMVPIEIKYRFENNIFILGGIQTGLLYDAWVDYEAKSDNKDAEIKQTNKSAFNKLDVGVAVGVGYKLKEKNDNGMSFFLQYYYGFLDAYKFMKNTNYSSLFLEATIPIGAN